ncbi:MAG: NAD(P)-dependent oxidoreductase [Pedobacter sp.]|nr:MAG: NAD(P)-dependent oxidoreductase [Pedobacter sp.]
MELKKIAIVGAAGFVGLELVSQLEQYNQYELYAITRDNGNFLLKERNIKLISESDIGKYHPFDAVINLAYPTVQNTALFPETNKKILNTLQKLCDANTRLIQVSTQAVFGFGMEHEVVTSLIPKRRDYPYIEAKLEMEHFVKEIPTKETAIVRLGNVWGEGSAVWTGSLVEKLLFGQYTGVENADGYANITDVKNVANYLVFLLQKAELSNFRIYHLAEFSSAKWSHIVNELARELNVDVVLSDVVPSDTASLISETKGMFKAAIGSTWGKINLAKMSSSYLRSAIRFYGVDKFQKMKQNRNKPLPRLAKLSESDIKFLTVLTSNVEFKSVLDPEWVPLVNYQESLSLVKSWMKNVGY